MINFKNKIAEEILNKFITCKIIDVSNYDLYLTKNDKQIVGLFTYNLNEYEEKNNNSNLQYNCNIASASGSYVISTFFAFNRKNEFI